LHGIYNCPTPYDASHQKVKWLNKLLTELLCKEALPFSLVDSLAFRAFVQELDLRYILPCRQTLSSKMIPDLYANLTENITVCS